MITLLQGLVVLGCLGLGARKGGVAVGLWGGVGVLILAAVFHLPPGNFPIAAMSIIFAVVAAAGAMQVAGGIQYLVNIAHRLLRAHPKYITFVAPVVSWIFTIGAGTGNVYYSLLPVIEEVSYSNRIRPERPLALSPEASQLGITSSPVSAAMAIMVGLLAPYGFDLPDILIIVLPATLGAILIAAFIQNFYGRELDKDLAYLRRLQNGEIKKPPPIESVSTAQMKTARMSTWLFVGGILMVVLFGFLEGIRPQVYGTDGQLQPMSMTLLITAIMMLAAVAILIVTKVKPSKVPQSNVFQAGMVAILALMGIAWMANTFIGANREVLSSIMVGQVQSNIWLLPLVFYATAALTTSQSTTTLIVVPVALAIGVSPAYVVASWLAVIGIHFFPANGSQIATIEFDRSGTTKIGNFVLNHSFLLPNVVVASASVGLAFIIVKLFLS